MGGERERERERERQREREREMEKKQTVPFGSSCVASFSETVRRSMGCGMAFA